MPGASAIWPRDGKAYALGFFSDRKVPAISLNKNRRLNYWEIIERRERYDQRS
jgi:hypothetical protein